MDRKKKDDLPKMQVGFIDFICMPVYKVSRKWSDEYRAFSHDVASAISVFQNNATAAILLFQTNHLRVEHLSCVTSFFCVNKFGWLLITWVKTSYMNFIHWHPPEWRHNCKEGQYTCVVISEVVNAGLFAITLLYLQWANFEPVKIWFSKRVLLHYPHLFFASFDHLHSALYNWTTRVSLSKIRSGMF